MTQDQDASQRPVPVTAAGVPQPHVPDVSELLTLAVECGVIRMSKVMDPDLQDALTAFAKHLLAAAPAAEPVYGDVLPAVGSRVFIRHGRDDDAHACIVTGYYAWHDLEGNRSLHRVFVRVVYEGTDTPNARMLNECWSTADAALAKAAPATAGVPLTDDECDKLAAQAMDALAAKRDTHALDLNPAITAHHSLRRALIRAGATLAVAPAAASDVRRVLTGTALREIAGRLEPLSDMEDEAQVSAWWKIYAGHVRNALAVRDEDDAWSEIQLDGIAAAVREKCGPATARRVRTLLATAHAPQTTAQAAADALARAVTNLQCDHERSTDEYADRRHAYIFGHRDARQAAVELTLAACAPRAVAAEVTHPADQVLAWADDYEREGGHGLVVQMLRSYAALITALQHPTQAESLTADELALFAETVEQFADDGETSTDYDTLLAWAARGLLECPHFVVTENGRTEIEHMDRTAPAGDGAKR